MVCSGNNNNHNSIFLLQYPCSIVPGKGSFQPKIHTSKRPRVVIASHAANVQVQAFYSLLFDNEALTYQNLPLLITYCVKAIHAVNAVLWHPGEHAQKSQTDRQADKPDDYYTRWPRHGLSTVSGNNSSHCVLLHVDVNRLKLHVLMYVRT